MEAVDRALKRCGLLILLRRPGFPHEVTPAQVGETVMDLVVEYMPQAFRMADGRKMMRAIQG